MQARTLDPGAISARLDLDIAADMADGQGGATPGFAPAGTVWARIEPRAVMADVQRDEAVSAVTHDIWIRWREDVSSGMRLRKGDRIFEIHAVSDPDETRRYLVCRCREAGQ